jgi:hypothetical protein
MSPKEGLIQGQGHTVTDRSSVFFDPLHLDLGKDKSLIFFFHEESARVDIIQNGCLTHLSIIPIHVVHSFTIFRATKLSHAKYVSRCSGHAGQNTVYCPKYGLRSDSGSWSFVASAARSSGMCTYSFLYFLQANYLFLQFQNLGFSSIRTQVLQKITDGVTSVISQALQIPL